MANGRRLYRDVVDKMLSMIDSGKYPVGGRLPPERELAEMFEVSRPTVREAIIALEALERVTVKTGSGVYVIEHPDLGGWPEAVLQRAQDPVLVVAVPLELKDGVHDVFQRSRAGKRAVLGDVAHEEHGDR